MSQYIDPVAQIFLEVKLARVIGTSSLPKPYL